MILQQVLQFIQDPQSHSASALPYKDALLLTLVFCIVPTLIAMVISVPLGVLVARRPLAAFLATNGAGIVRAVPILAILILVGGIPWLSNGYTSTIGALTLIGIPPLLLNTIAGLRGIDPAAIDAARGMGMTGWQVLARVRIPLVLPVVAAGVRTAAVQIVATTPVAALFGSAGFGDYIVTGFYTLDYPQALAGAASIALLAIVTEFALSALQRAVTPAGVRQRASAATRQPAVAQIA